jgi:hypothetical protein
MHTRTIAVLAVIAMLAGALYLWAGPFSAQRLEAAPPPESSRQYSTPALTPGIYLTNLLFLYIANPDVAANLPAYRAPIPQPVIDCLKRHPNGSGCPYAEYKHLLDNPQIDGHDDARECFWPLPCQERPVWARMAPPELRRAAHLNMPLGRKKADRLARSLGVTDGMVLTEREYRCMIGTPPRTRDQQIMFECILNMTGSIGHAAIPLSSYGLNVNEDGNVRSICAPGAPCQKVNTLLGKYLDTVARECGFLEKLLRMETETPFKELAVDGFTCQKSGGPACLIARTCAGC